MLVAAGCSGDEAERLDVVPVTGKVLYNDRPLPGAQVTFRCEEKNAPPAMGITGPDGTFQLTTYDDGDGAVPGEHLVTVAKYASTGGSGAGGPETMEEAAARAEKGIELEAESRSLIPEAYADPERSNLRETVKEDGENNFTIELSG
ncbi:MAG: carboxypeptidase-like regulatory domain-containing protein [Planctomycetes bacterium]|nr:carboxypeptidase-like regulatory domain-containing protein [Planctomycetota bacterium]